MVEKRPNLRASVRAKLLNQSRASGQPFDLTLVRFALERLLYRLSISAHSERFILKGAMLLTTWFDDPLRPTRDLDLLGFGDPDPEAMQATFAEILAIEADDGIVFNSDALRVDRIREALDYGGVRLRAIADVGGARVPVAIDVGFGDALEPGAEMLDYPTLLDQPAPKLRAYARETVIAEKFQAMVALGRANSRMKDFYDIWLLATTFPFEGDRLARAIMATFERRKTAIPDQLPDALTSDFGEDPAKIQQWEAFKRDLGTDPGNLADVCAALASFLGPRATAARAL
jgi:predicted nucleotidyltransferase component of viral defense system